MNISLHQSYTIQIQVRIQDYCKEGVVGRRERLWGVEGGGVLHQICLKKSVLQ